MGDNTVPNWGPEIRRFPRWRADRRTATGGSAGPGPQGGEPEVFAPLPRKAVEAFAGRDGEVPRYVVHLAVVTRDLAGAATLACALVRSLDFLPELDAGETTVSAEDNQGVRQRVFCDRLLPDRRRCALRDRHAGGCAPTVPP